jgi:two-component system osmolarity sensor histidine kinase EnvZ
MSYVRALNIWPPVRQLLNRTIIPKSLYVRSLIILLLPIIVLQAVIAYIFYNRHLDTVTRSLSENIAGSLAIVAERLELERDPNVQTYIVEEAARTLRLRLQLINIPNFEPGRLGLATGAPMRHIDDKVVEGFERFINRPFVIDLRPNDPEIVEVVISLPTTALRAQIPKDRVTSTSTQLLLTWMLITGGVVALVSIYYMKLQVTPIRRLAKAVANFGKGRDDGEIRPEGPIEVRRAAQAFNRMRRRILRHIGQRTELLATVSHDLRTPLTRMRLGLEVMGHEDDEMTEELKKDVGEMMELVDLYLAFARGEGSEQVQILPVAPLIENVVDRIDDGQTEIRLFLDRSIDLSLRPISFRRCLANIIDNAQNVAELIKITLAARDDQVAIVIEDNGPGVPPELYDEILKPFVSRESSSRAGRSGTGLGLAIANDIVLGHGGELTVDRSPLGGLRITISLPA